MLSSEPLKLPLASNTIYDEMVYGVISCTIFIIYAAFIFVLWWRYNSIDRRVLEAWNEANKVYSEPGSI